MRRKDREISDPLFFQELFRKCDVIVLSFHDGEFPYAVPLSFVEYEGALYMHCALEGHKLDCIARDPHVHFNAFDSVEVDLVKASAHFRSVSGSGLAETVEDEEERRAVMCALMQKYTGRGEIPAHKDMGRTLVVKIAVTSLTGKQHAKPAA